MGSKSKPSAAASNSSRGGIAKRKSRNTDRDGDVSMGTTSASRGGGISKAKPSRRAPQAGAERGGRTAPRLNHERAQREILRHVKSGESSRTSAPTNRHSEEIKVTGWKNSKAANNDDGGLNSLIAWLEKKATLKTGPSRRAVKVRKSRADGDDLIITADGADVGAILRLDGWVFAGANIKLARAESTDGATKETTWAMLKAVLARRYDANAKLLDLTSLGTDPDLKASAIFDSRSTTSKFFPALMKVLDSQFESAAAKHDAILSVTLANNDLPNLTAVTSLAQTLPQLRNLDLSNNAFKDLAAIEAWRRKFPKLDHLVLAPNPLEQNEPDYATKVMNWYPKLRLLNSMQVRSDEEMTKPVHISDLPFPIRSPNFQDDGGIAENFLRTFFVGYDGDRNTLAHHYYDAQSDFSLAVNTQAPRDPAGTVTSEAHDWDLYIKRSRNLKEIQQLPARQARIYRGPQNIADAWASLPTTRHPDLVTEAAKWSIECQVLAGVPDPTGASPSGVDGFLVTVHSEFNEIDISTGAITKTRSFDRAFTLGPGGPTGVRVVNDMLTIRAYGGAQAFVPEENLPTQALTNGVDAAAAVAAVIPGMPAGLTPEIAEQMLIELQKQTGMVVGYAKDCLDQVQWDFNRALETFNNVRANLPAEAFAAV